jgi:hypothetical protein
MKIQYTHKCLHTHICAPCEHHEETKPTDFDNDDFIIVVSVGYFEYAKKQRH